jgi:hypothetical protein
VQGSGVRLCDQTIAGNPGGTARSTVKTFDTVPIDVRVAFPPEPPSGPDGPYPLIMLFHGYAGSKLSLANMQPFLNAGYATFSMTTRGFGQSCGATASRTADPTGCAEGHVRLMDTRYEVRDAQEFAGLLADEGRTAFTQIGAIGGSYGGGTSMALGALKDRKMLPDGSLVAWQSPNGTPMQIAAATPEIPWTDLAASLTPNGGTLDYVADAPYQGRTGVLKSSWENALYNSGLGAGFYAAAGHDPDADLRNWHITFNNGEPYDDGSGNPLAAFVVLHRPQRATGTDADLERLDRRPVPGRRGCPLLQPHQDAVPERRHLAALRQLRAPARAEQGRCAGRTCGAGDGVVRLLRQGNRTGAVPRRHDVHTDLPERGRLGRSVRGTDVAAAGPG